MRISRERSDIIEQSAISLKNSPFGEFLGCIEVQANLAITSQSVIDTFKVTPLKPDADVTIHDVAFCHVRFALEYIFVRKERRRGKKAVCHIVKTLVDVNRGFIILDVIILVALVNLCGKVCLLYTSPSPRDLSTSRMPSSA